MYFFYYAFSNKRLWNSPGQVSGTFILNPTVLIANNRKVATKWVSGGLKLRRQIMYVETIWMGRGHQGTVISQLASIQRSPTQGPEAVWSAAWAGWKHLMVQRKKKLSIPTRSFELMMQTEYVTKVFYLPTDAQYSCFKRILKFTLKQLLHVSVQSPSSGSVLFELAKVIVIKIIS